MKITLLILIAFFGSFFTGRTQSFHGVMNGSLNVASVIELSVIPNVGSNVTIDGTNINSGITNNNLSTIRVKTNQSWILSVRATSPFFTASGIYASSNMPVSVLNIIAPSGQLTLSSTNQQIALGGRGNFDATGNTLQLGLKASPGYNYGPGIYTTNLVYTLTSQ